MIKLEYLFPEFLEGKKGQVIDTLTGVPENYLCQVGKKGATELTFYKASLYRVVFKSGEIFNIQVSNVEAITPVTETPSLVNRIIVGAKGDYLTIKEAVDWFNASATANTEILLDGGIHIIDAGITVNNATYSLCIKGLCTGTSLVNASAGLAVSAFTIKSSCDFSKFTTTGSKNVNSNFIDFVDDGNFIVSDISNMVIDSYQVAINDEEGVILLVEHFNIINCPYGIIINHSHASPRITKVANGLFDECGYGISLTKTGATGDSFVIRQVTFKNPSEGFAITYVGADYVYGIFAEITGCSYNGVGTFLSGFDFTLSSGRDANINIVNNVGIENKKAHAYLQDSDNTDVTTIVTAGTLYPIVLSASPTLYTCKVTLTSNKMIYQPLDSDDGEMFISGSLSVDGTNRNVEIGIIKNGTGSFITSQKIRASVSGQPYIFSFMAYVDDIETGDYYEIFVTSSSNGDEVTIENINAYFNIR